MWWYGLKLHLAVILLSAAARLKCIPKQGSSATRNTRRHAVLDFTTHWTAEKDRAGTGYRCGERYRPLIISRKIAAALGEFRKRIPLAKTSSSSLAESVNAATWNMHEFGLLSTSLMRCD